MSQATENCEQPVGESQVTSSEQMVIAIQYLKSLNIASYLVSYSVKDFFSLDHIKYRKLKDYPL